MLRVAQVVVCLAGLYLLALGVTSVLRPSRAKQFLEAHVSTLRAHVLELTLRTVVGAALVVASPAMRGESLARAAGWVLLVTTLVLALTPWRYHQRFAAWSVPMATRSMPLVAIGALGGGFAIFAALLGGSPVP